MLWYTHWLNFLLNQDHRGRDLVTHTVPIKSEFRFSCCPLQLSVISQQAKAMSAVQLPVSMRLPLAVAGETQSLRHGQVKGMPCPFDAEHPITV